MAEQPDSSRISDIILRGGEFDLPSPDDIFVAPSRVAEALNIHHIAFEQQVCAAKREECEHTMNIGQAAERSGLPTKTIRYYEEIGLISADRAANGYRDYSDADVHRLAFIQRARALGFSIEDCRQLMDLYRDRNRASHDVRELAKAHVSAIDAKIAELTAMRSTLSHLVAACRGDARPDCPILDDMAAGSA